MLSRFSCLFICPTGCLLQVDTLKDMVDGFAGMGLALLGLATRGGGNNNTASIGGCPDSTDA